MCPPITLSLAYVPGKHFTRSTSSSPPLLVLLGQAAFYPILHAKVCVVHCVDDAYADAITYNQVHGEKRQVRNVIDDSSTSFFVTRGY